MPRCRPLLWPQHHAGVHSPTPGGARSGIQISQLPPKTRLDAPWPRQVRGEGRSVRRKVGRRAWQPVAALVSSFCVLRLPASPFTDLPQPPPATAPHPQRIAVKGTPLAVAHYAEADLYAVLSSRQVRTRGAAGQPRCRETGGATGRAGVVGGAPKRASLVQSPSLPPLRTRATPTHAHTHRPHPPPQVPFKPFLPEEDEPGEPQASYSYGLAQAAAKARGVMQVRW